MYRMKKKFLSLILVSTLSLAMGITAFANKSPQKDSIVTDYVTAVDKNGDEVRIIIEDLTPEGEKLVKQLENKEFLKSVLGDHYVEGMGVLDGREVRVIGKAVFPITVTFKVPGVLASTNVAIAHYENGKWVEEPSKAGKGTITATFDSLSPVAFIVDKNTSASSTESPKTGETPVVAVVGIVAVLAVTGAIVSRKRTASK